LGEKSKDWLGARGSTEEQPSGDVDVATEYRRCGGKRVTWKVTNTRGGGYPKRLKIKFGRDQWGTNATSWGKKWGVGGRDDHTNYNLSE